MELIADDQNENIPAYKAAVKKGVADPFPYDRLMIHYRKPKEYKNELEVINKGIKVFETQLEKLQNKAIAKNKKRPVIEKLSHAISKTSGLMDKKGKPTFIPEPIAKWLKRKAVVEKKIASA